MLSTADFTNMDADAILDKFPKTLYSIRKKLDIDRDSMTKFVICKKCHTRYTYEQAIELLPDGQWRSKKCGSRKFSHHRLERFTQRCGTKLLKVRISNKGKAFPYPEKIYAFQSVSKSLERLYNSNHNLTTDLEHWRPQNNEYLITDDDNRILAVVYDGQLWKDFQSVHGKPFLAQPDNLALLLNIDWFQPFKYTTYSIGAMYLVIMNLPRSERFKIENIIVVGIIDGPREPKLNQLDQYIAPLVSDMQDLWEGVFIDDKNSVIGKRLVRAAILGLSSDIPATRKIGGFVSHGARKGCSKCLSEFPRIENSLKADYSAFESLMEPRDPAQHIKLAKDTRNCKTLAEKHEKEMRDGVRWTPLFDLPHYDPIRCHVIDPMHCLSGITSHAMNTWKELDIINSQNLANIQEKLDSVKVPSDVGRIPYKIESNFSGLTADQLLNWTMIFSIYVLFGAIPDKYLNIWRLFVAACRLLCRDKISIKDAKMATKLLKQYCILFRDMYGPARCTPNMHLSLHIESCVMDYGSVYSFWCFSFERYNGMFEHFHTNKQDIPIQLMRKFQQNKLVQLELSASNVDGLFKTGYVSVNSDPHRGTLGQIHSRDWHRSDDLTTATDFPVDFSGTSTINQLIGNGTSGFFSHETQIELFKVVQFLYPNSLRISHNFERFKLCKIGRHPTAVQRYEHDRSCCIEANWITISNNEPSICLNGDMRPGIVKDLLKFSVLFNEAQPKILVIAEVKWMADSPHRFYYGRNAPVSVWSKNFLFTDATSFIPLNRIRGRCGFVHTSLQIHEGRNTNVNVVIQL